MAFDEDEIEFWKWYDRAIGLDDSWLQNAMVCEMLAALLGAKNIDRADFLPGLRGKKKGVKVQSADAMKQFCKAFAARFKKAEPANKEIVKKAGKKNKKEING